MERMRTPWDPQGTDAREVLNITIIKIIALFHVCHMICLWNPHFILSHDFSNPLHTIFLG